MRSIVITFIFLFLSVFVDGQTVSRGMSKTDLDTKIQTFKNHKQYEVRYDKFKDVTTVLAKHFVIARGKNIFNVQSVNCSAGFEFNREILKQDVEHFILAIEVTSQHQRMFSSLPSLILLIDGERFKPEEGDYKKDILPITTSTDETILYSIDAKVFSKMANAKQIEFQIGDKEFHFKSETLEMFQNLYQLASTH